ncbi:MAG TPA: beta-ketoacyl synthase N-terminal-like domain-containing protein, partial [Pyrinomonadaceae bacterium]
MSGSNGKLRSSEVVGRRVVITGTGALSALGRTTQELWDGLIANRAGIRTVERLVASGISVTTGGEVDAVPHDQVDRDHEIANRAIDDALISARRQPSGCGFIWSTGLDTFQADSQGFVHRSAGRCFSKLASRFLEPKRMIAAACASGTQAVGEAFRLIKSGRADACVAGGSSVMLTPFYLIGFAGLQAVATDNGD